jgi:hypothetical protein
VRHTTQLRRCADEGCVACCSEAEAEEAALAGGLGVAAEPVTGGACDMMKGIGEEALSSVCCSVMSP